MKKFLLNNSGHGQVPSGKDMLKIIGVVLTCPVSIPVLMLIDKIKAKKEKK